ncbi:hypothetical protein HYW54_03195 [Candidatus Gottesmanbacteria bacterium]|nr:hypothetical protein [Candidatus Gottesmanbacteria bacterium]
MQKENLNRWFKSIVISLIIFFLFSIYLLLRRGYFNLYIANKVFGSSAVIIAGLTLLIGPVSKKIQNLAKFMTIRRHLGLIALLFAIIHTLVSFFFLPEKFPLSWYGKEIVPVFFGLLALGLWLYLAYLSENERILKMGSDLWKKHLSLGGKIAFLFVFFHLVVMKYPGWLRWFQGQTKQTPELLNPEYPPASLFVFIAMLGIIVYRILNDYFLPQKK